MYSEAEAALKPAVKSDEFNSELRYLDGVALEGLRKLDDAVDSFSLSLRLDASQWPAAKHLMQCFSEKYAQSAANQDRVSLGRAAAQVVSFASDTLMNPATEGNLGESQKRAAEILELLNSPVGTWGDDSPQFRVRASPDSPSAFDVQGEKGGSVMFGKFRRQTAHEFYGNIYDAKGPCVFDIEVAVTLQDFGTRLLVKERTSRYKGPDPRIKNLSNVTGLRAGDKVCGDLVRRGDGFYPLNMAVRRMHSAPE
jgi:hypothetical protein